MVQILVRSFVFLLVFLSLISGVNSLSFTTDTTPEFIFKQNTNSSIIFSCVDANDFVCESTYSCNVTVVNPNSSILLDNSATTRQSNYYNISLPNTNTLGIHPYNIFCTNGTDAGSSTELSYLVNLTGEELSISKVILYLVVMLVTVSLFLLSLLGSIKIPWNNNTDDEGFIVSVSDLKYVKLVLWFVTYIFLIFITWLTASIAKFLELGMASGFFDVVYLTLLVFVAPVFIIVFVIGIIRGFSDKNIEKMLGRNLKFK